MKLIIAFLLFTPIISSAQVNDLIPMEELSENQLPSADQDVDTSESIENYTQLLAHRIDLNTATAEQFRILNLLSDQQINELVAHRTSYGKFLSLYELQAVNGFDLAVIRAVQRYVVVRDPLSRIDRGLLRRMKEDAETYFVIRYDRLFQRKKGFNAEDESQRFQGHEGRVTWRFRSYRAGDFSFGITAEQDAGEKYRWHPSNKQFGFDHLAVHAQLQNKGRIANLIVGDYHAQFGQGLIWGGGIGFGKGAEAITNIRRAGIGLIPNASAYEAGGLKGMASTIKVSRNVSLSTIYSRARRDAAIQGDSMPSVSSIPTAGLHRNSRELEKRKQMTETVSGLVVEFNSNGFSTGVTYQKTEFDTPIRPVQRLYNHHSFRGITNHNVGLFTSVSIGNVALFHEAAHTINEGTALTQGALISLSGRLDMSLLYRRFEKNYQSFTASALAENTRPQNETGVYWGIHYKFPHRIRYSGYVDMFRFPGLKYRTYSPSIGHEWLSRIQWDPTRTMSAFLQVRREQKSRNLPAGDESVYKLQLFKKTSYWINIDHQPTKALRMRTRFQWSTFQSGITTTRGYALAQDVAWQFGKLRTTMRYAIFSTDDWDNRHYIYEHDVWLSYSFPAYGGRGIRTYLLWQYKLNKTVTFWLKYSQTRFTDREIIGTGMDEIAGNKQNDLKFEVRVKL